MTDRFERGQDGKIRGTNLCVRQILWNWNDDSSCAIEKPRGLDAGNLGKLLQPVRLEKRHEIIGGIGQWSKFGFPIVQLLTHPKQVQHFGVAPGDLLPEPVPQLEICQKNNSAEH